MIRIWTTFGWYFARLALIIGVYVAYRIIDLLLRRPYIDRHADRYVLVTGCDSGFGYELCKRLDSLGCHVFAGCLTESGETELKKRCSRRLVTVRMDVSKPDSVRGALKVVTEKLHADKAELWAIVNNAGAACNVGPPEWLTVDDYRTTADVNVYGLIDVTMTFLPLIKKSRGRVVNMASIVGRFSLFGIYPYSVSKYGVEAFTDGLRRSMRPFGVKVLLIEPGFFKTNLLSTSLYENRLQASWNQTTQEIRDEYGTDYLEYLKTQLPKKSQDLASGRIEDVVDVYESALFSRIPRARYIVGLDALLLFRTLSMLPEWLADWIVDRLDRDKPLPAALRK